MESNTEYYFNRFGHVYRVENKTSSLIDYLLSGKMITDRESNERFGISVSTIASRYKKKYNFEKVKVKRFGVRPVTKYRIKIDKRRNI